MTTIAASGAASATSRVAAAGSATPPTCPASAQPRRTTGAQGLLSTPDCQGKGAEGCARCLYAQADRHPQHPDRPTAEMGSQPLRAELSERALTALGFCP